MRLQGGLCDASFNSMKKKGKKGDPAAVPGSPAGRVGRDTALGGSGPLTPSVGFSGR